MLLRDVGFPMLCSRKRLCACFAVQKLILQIPPMYTDKNSTANTCCSQNMTTFLERFLIICDKMHSGSKCRPLHQCLSVDRGWAQVGRFKAMEQFRIKVLPGSTPWLRLHAGSTVVYMVTECIALQWCLGTLPHWSDGFLMRLCYLATVNYSNCCKTLWECSSTSITCCNIATPTRLINILMQLGSTPIKTFIWRVSQNGATWNWTYGLIFLCM